LKIIQVFNRYLQPGGEEKSVARIAEDLESAGHTVTRFWRESSEWQNHAKPPRWRQPFLMWRNPEVLRPLREQQSAARADVWLLHNVVPVVSLGVYALARELGVPVLQWLHNYRPISPSGSLFAGTRLLSPEEQWIGLKETWAGSWNGRIATAFLAFYYRRLRRNGDFDAVRAWVAVSEEMRRIFERARWYPHRLHTLRHSWHAQPAPTTERDDGYFLFLGRMVETKGVRFLMDLWRSPQLRGVKLIMAGEGPLREEMQRQSPPNVEWVGHVEGEVKRRLKEGCRAIVFPSVWPEPLSTVAYEAYEVNKPILASRLGGMPEIVTSGETGILLPPAQLADWRDAILNLTPERSREWGRAGRAWLSAHVSPQAWGAEFNRIAEKAGLRP
jgi:glycosyltransferase involved in cell wall biosynthesis